MPNIENLFEQVLELDASASLSRHPHAGKWEVGLYHDHMGSNEMQEGDTIETALTAALEWLKANPRDQWEQRRYAEEVAFDIAMERERAAEVPHAD